LQAGEPSSSTTEAISRDIDSAALGLTIFGSKSQLSGSESPAPCIVMIHAGFGVSMLPSVNLALLSFVKDFGGIICLVHARGGGITLIIKVIYIL
jgi:protease II